MYIVTILSTALLLFLDQIAKYLAVLHLKGQATIPIIKNVFELQYLENQGAAFGIMQGKKTFFVIGTLIFLVIVVILYHNIPLTKRFTPIRIVAVLIVAGAIGNMIDRVVHQYVIDFFYFTFCKYHFHQYIFFPLLSYFFSNLLLQHIHDIHFQICLSHYNA